MNEPKNITGVRPAVFLDRDGTINLDSAEYKYVTKVEDFHLLDGVGEALRRLHAAGYLLVLITNQACIGRGLLDEKGLKKIHEYMQKLLGEQGVKLDGIYFCPDHPEATVERYRRESDRRKPEPGMILEAAKEMGIDLGKSWMIGNKPHDAQAGKRAGCRTILLTRPEISGGEAGEVLDTQHADFTAGNILEAAEIVIEQDVSLAQDQEGSRKRVLRPRPTQLDSRQILSDILRELRHQRIAPRREFTVGKMFAGIIQCGVLFCLVIAYVGFSYWSWRAIWVCLTVGLILQMMVVALLLAHRDR